MLYIKILFSNGISVVGQIMLKGQQTLAFLSTNYEGNYISGVIALPVSPELISVHRCFCIQTEHPMYIYDQKASFNVLLVSCIRNGLYN